MTCFLKFFSFILKLISSLLFMKVCMENTQRCRHSLPQQTTTTSSQFPPTHNDVVTVHPNTQRHRHSSHQHITTSSQFTPTSSPSTPTHNDIVTVHPNTQPRRHSSHQHITTSSQFTPTTSSPHNDVITVHPNDVVTVNIYHTWSLSASATAFAILLIRSRSATLWIKNNII